MLTLTNFFFIVFSIFNSAVCKESEESINLANKFIAERWRLLNETIDSYFSNQSYSNLTKENHSRLFLTASFYKKEGKKIENAFDFQLRVDFPKTAKKLKVVIEKEQNDVSNLINPLSSKKNSISANSTNTTKRKYTAGIGILFKDTPYYKGSAHFGLRLDVPLNPYLKLNFKRDFVLNTMTMTFAQQFNIYRQKGFQEITQILLTRKWNKKLETNFVNTLAWTDETDAFDMRNNFIISYSIEEEKLLTFSLGANAKLSPMLYYNSYDFSAGYRRLIFGKWLYGSIVVGAEYFKSSHFQQEKFAQFTLDLFFKE